MNLIIKCACLIMLIGYSLIGSPANASDGGLINTDICSVVSHPGQYKDKTIRLSAMVLISKDGNLLAPDMVSNNVVLFNISFDAAKDPSVKRFVRQAYFHVPDHDPPLVDLSGVLRIDSSTRYKVVVDLRHVYAFSITPAGTRKKSLKLCKMPKQGKK